MSGFSLRPVGLRLCIALARQLVAGGSVRIVVAEVWKALLKMGLG
jgi:hypothetical protein